MAHNIFVVVLPTLRWWFSKAMLVDQTVIHRFFGWFVGDLVIFDQYVIQWPFQEPELEVPTIYKDYTAYVRPTQ